MESVKIVVSGPAKSGKSTIVKIIEQSLRHASYNVKIDLDGLEINNDVLPTVEIVENLKT